MLTISFQCLIKKKKNSLIKAIKMSKVCKYVKINKKKLAKNGFLKKSFQKFGKVTLKLVSNKEKCSN